MKSKITIAVVLPLLLLQGCAEMYVQSSSSSGMATVAGSAVVKVLSPIVSCPAGTTAVATGGTTAYVGYYGRLHDNFMYAQRCVPNNFVRPY